MGGKKPLRRPLWPPTRATASNYYPLGLDGAGGAAKPLLRAPKKPAPLHGRLPAFSGAVDAFERARKCFLEWRYFFSIILSEFLKNRVALQVKTAECAIPIYANAEKDNGLYGYTDTARENELSITVAARGTIGFTAIRREPFLPVVRLITVVPDLSTVSERYLYYALRNCKPASSGTSIPQLTVPDIKKNEIELYSLSVQETIADKLDAVGRVIELRQQQLQTLDELVKARFIELFGDPVLNQHGWRKVALEVNATLLNGRAYKQDELLDSGKYPVLRVGNFFSNRGWYYSDLELDDDKYCDNGDLLYAWSASFGPQIWNGGKVIYHYHIWKVLVGEAYNRQFLCKLLEYATESLMGDTHGIAMMHLTKSGMEKTEFIVPPSERQEQFAAFVEQADKSKVAVQKALDEAQLLFDSLMQKYFG